MKIICFSSINLRDLENRVNNFLSQDKIKFIDIKFSTSHDLSEVLIVYEERENIPEVDNGFLKTQVNHKKRGKRK